MTFTLQAGGTLTATHNHCDVWIDADGSEVRPGVANFGSGTRWRVTFGSRLVDEGYAPNVMKAIDEARAAADTLNVRAAADTLNVRSAA